MQKGPLDLSRTQVSLRSGVWSDPGLAATARADTVVRVFVGFQDEYGIPISCAYAWNSLDVEFNPSQAGNYRSRPQPSVTRISCDPDTPYQGVSSLSVQVTLFSVIPELQPELLLVYEGQNITLLSFELLPGPVNQYASGLGIPHESLTVISGHPFQLSAVLVDSYGNLCPSACNVGSITVYSDASLSYLTVYTAYFEVEHGICALTVSEDAANYLEGENALMRILGVETAAHVAELPYFTDLKLDYNWGELLRTVGRGVPLEVLEDAAWQRWVALGVAIVLIVVALVLFFQCGVMRVSKELAEQRRAKEQADQDNMAMMKLQNDMLGVGSSGPPRERASILGSNQNSMDS